MVECGHVRSTIRNSTSVYIDAVRDPAAFAGNGTLALEILEDLPDVDAIFVPFGGGGLACGIANAVRALRPAVKVIVVRAGDCASVQVGARSRRPVDSPCDPGFVTGVGFGSVLPEMWPVASRLIDDTLTVSLSEVVAAIRLMAEGNKVIAEGAGSDCSRGGVVESAPVQQCVCCSVRRQPGPRAAREDPARRRHLTKVSQ